MERGRKQRGRQARRERTDDKSGKKKQRRGKLIEAVKQGRNEGEIQEGKEKVEKQGSR